MRSFGFITVAVATLLPVACNGKTIMDYLRTDDRLYEARAIAEEAGILDDIDPSRFGTQLTLMLPSNEAFDQLNAEHPKWRQALINNKQNVETLILFAASDMVVTPASIRSGKWEAEGSIVSLLSETASIASDGYVCVSDYTRTASCDDPDSLPCCAMVDLDNVIKAEDGYIYLVDAVMMPQEIVDKLP
ncbi:hypothetical protein, conserved [Eimeria maxima]|uniref:FAS1 domain-containing protein n=1 Tax=Eimeria maxima TaxID=5804 RepID=U6MAM8_EIMMA|nr:hypothetical protein, conserved [Eimeria maxima]CDJ61282.1 hypothetical protein, conserved [Eimeria maxima]